MLADRTGGVVAGAIRMDDVRLIGSFHKHDGSALAISANRRADGFE